MLECSITFTFRPEQELVWVQHYLDPPKYLRKWDMTLEKQVLVLIFRGTLRLQVYPKGEPQ